MTLSKQKSPSRFIALRPANCDKRRVYLHHTLIRKLLVSILFTFAVANPLYAENQPTPFTAYYNVVKGAMTVGETQRTLKVLDNGQYLFRSETNPRGIASLVTDANVSEESVWTYVNNAILPLRYNYRNSSGEKKREVNLLFDWDKSRVTNIINGDPWHMASVPGLLDKLLYQLKIMYDLSDGLKQLQYQVADGGKIKNFKLDILRNEVVKSDLGKFTTTVIQRVTERKTTTWWFAKELQYLPVKIQQTKKDGGSVVVTLYRVEGINIPATNNKPTD